MNRITGVLILAALVLSGCSTTVTHKSEDKLCTGTKKPYKIKGTWHTPQEHYHYEEEGVASWYGPRFHGQPKSCGEVFNMHGISAAHKTLPIPSVVRVTNVRNGASVKLLVDDRGPFVDDRIIDLSKGAATYLGICNQGLGKVRVECLPEESKAFARFVAQYGRYGRDPKGRSWETIFRQHFDHDECTPAPVTIRPAVYRQTPKEKERIRPQFAKHRQPFRRPNTKPAPVSQRPSDPLEEAVNEQEIDQLLNETRAYLGRRRA